MFADGQFPELAEKFKLNTARFAAYKAYKVTGVLKDLPAKNFKNNAINVIKNYNRYQAAEYNTIVARSRSAKQWKQFEKEAELYPNLEWLATASSNPRELHKHYVGIILPINDPFWKQNQPGNLWNCKCNWRTTDKGVTHKPANSVSAAPGLEGNPAETGNIFTDNHPYKKNVSSEQINKAILSMPPEYSYYKVNSKNGDLFVNVLHCHDNIDGFNKLTKHIDVAKDLLNYNFKKVSLLPEIMSTDNIYKDKFYPKGTILTEKNAEAIIVDNNNKEYVAEFKVITGNGSTLKGHIEDASLQADYIIIKFKGKQKNDSYIKIAEKKRLKLPNIKGILFISKYDKIFYNYGF